MKVYNKSKRVLLICCGIYDDRNSWVIGTLESGDSSELPFEESDFVNLMEVED